MLDRGPRVGTIPIQLGFADTLAAGLSARHPEPMALARGLVLLPNARAERAVRDAFVRLSGGGLLLPQLVSIGDPALDDRIGAALDPIEGPQVPPAIEPIARQLILARSIEEAMGARGRPVEAGEAMRLAADLGRTLDQLIVEEIDPSSLSNIIPDDLSEHWQASLDLLDVILERWPAELKRRGRIDLAARRNLLLDAMTGRWKASPPSGFVVAAGINVAGPAVARLLHRIARLPQGEVVLAGLDRAMPDDEWQALDPREDGRRPIETHPQLGLRRLLDRLEVARAEVEDWPAGIAGSTLKALAIGHAMKPAGFTDRWEALGADERRLDGITALELPTPAAEAAAIAVAMREVLEVPGRTAALVTPDRALAGRVAAQLERWGIAADDSAGRPLSLLAPGTLLLALAELVAEDFAPVPLLAVLKHPLVHGDDERTEWLDGVRTLDRALRGPRPGTGLAGIGRYLAGGGEASGNWQARDRRAALPFWSKVEALLAPLAAAGDGLGASLAALREAATRLAGDAVWSRQAGRAAAELLADLEADADLGPRNLSRAGLPAVLRDALDAQAIRPAQGGHPRLFIWGLIEARLQRTDLTILGGLNEGVWPGLPAPDPWLAPAIRKSLGLPGIEQRIGTEAQQFAAALGGEEVLLTRARRDARSPAVPSRFWLRLEAMSGGLPRRSGLASTTAGLDAPAGFVPAVRPAPVPPVADRPRRIAVTKLDRLRADPFAFYADAMLGLRALDAVDADPSAAWRGSAVHRILDAWQREDGCEPALLRARAEALLGEAAAHPVVRALWTPRLLEAIDWIAATVAEDRAGGRHILASEIKGKASLFGIMLEGTADRIDRQGDGSLAIVDYKTGKPPSKRAVHEGYAMQLGLLGLIAEHGGFEGIEGLPLAFEYWSLAASRDRTLGYREQPVGIDRRGEGIDPADFTSRALDMFEATVAKWLNGNAPFTAKLHPEYAPYGDYDQLMRLDEWYGRGPSDGDVDAA